MCIHMFSSSQPVSTKAVLTTLKEVDPLLGEQIDAFLVVLDSMDAAEARYGNMDSSPEDWDAELERVQRQLNEVESAIASFPDETEDEEAVGEATPMETDVTSGSVWTLLDESNWSPCPMGMLPGGVMPKLDLSPSSNPFVSK